MTAPASARPAGDADAGPPAAAALKARLAEELATLAQDMAAFQATLSEVLAAGSLSSSHVRQLQDLDRATQMLDNLHRVATALAAAHPHSVTPGDLESLVTLDDLKCRLAGVSGLDDAAQATADDGVSWF